jgi:hypothetical protein
MVRIENTKPAKRVKQQNPAKAKLLANCKKIIGADKKTMHVLGVPSNAEAPKLIDAINDSALHKFTLTIILSCLQTISPSSYDLTPD